MLSLGLTAAEYAEYVAKLASSADIKTKVQVLDNEHRVLGDVSHLLMDGQTDVVAPKFQGQDVPISRTSTCSFLDPGHSLALDSNSPSDGAIYLDRMLRAIVSVRCSFGWVDVPIFTGPITKVDRDGDFVNVEAHGKEAFALGEAYYDLADFKGTKTKVVRDLMALSGETSRYLELPDSASKVVKPVTLTRSSKPWPKAFGVERSRNRFFAYNGRGVARSIVRPSKPAMVLRHGPGSMLLSDPQISYSTEDMKNIVRVTGRATSGTKETPIGVAVAPSGHPLNAYRIGRNGKPVWHARFENNPDVRTKAAALSMASSLLEDDLAQTVNLTMDVLPIYHLEEWDLLRYEGDDFALTFRPATFTIPWTVRGVMTLGYTRKVTKPRRPIRSV